MALEFDVLIVGAGVSGIGAAYHLQAECPGRSYAVLEARAALGGTWDLFRYPGIRSDSDMQTFGYAFRPWPDARAIADGPSILQYLKDTAAEYGIDQRIRFRQRVEVVRWSSQDARWTVLAVDPATGAATEYRCRFLYLCAGYYRAEAGFTPDFPGRERFRGRVVHPQQWTPDVDYAGRRVVVIGSGATAITLVPELAKQAAQVTMVQRSPTWLGRLPAKDPVAVALGPWLPAGLVYALVRWKNIVLGLLFFQFCRAFPRLARRVLLRGVAKELGGAVPVEPDFAPRYDPWDQRLCLAPDGDFFTAVREGRARVVTGTIRAFTETGLELDSGEHLPADLIVTATGFTLQLLGGAAVEVDGQPITGPEHFVYRGCMLSGVPNLAFAVGYTNATWTLKVDLVAEYVCRLLNELAATGKQVCVPQVGTPPPTPSPLLDFDAGYVKRSAHLLPRQGTRAPWKLAQNYLLDVLLLRYGSLHDGAMQFR